MKSNVPVNGRGLHPVLKRGKLLNQEQSDTSLPFFAVAIMPFREEAET
jgi:hypothetical protein